MIVNRRNLILFKSNWRDLYIYAINKLYFCICTKIVSLPQVSLQPYLAIIIIIIYFNGHVY
jgi:hypothetical protein